MLARIGVFFRERRLHLVLALTSSVLAFVAFIGFDQWYLMWVALVPVIWALDDTSLSRKEALAISWIFGTIAYFGGYTWITGMLIDFGHLAWPLAVLGTLLLCFGQGLLFALWGLGLNRLLRRGVSAVWAVPVLMVVCEWLVPALFPAYLGNSQYRQLALIQSLDLWGPLGITFLVTLGSGVVYQTLAWRFRRRGAFPRWSWAALLLLVGADLSYGVLAIANVDDTVAHAERRQKIGMVQVNMGIYQKDEEPEEGARRHREQSLELEAQGAELIVWPESGFNYALPTGITNVKQYVMGELATPLLFGALRVERREGKRLAYNTAFLVDGDGDVMGTYDKIFLLAFGEYVPFGDWFPSLYDSSLFRHTGHYQRGTHNHPLVLDGSKYGVLICYEDILPRFVRRAMAEQPHVLVNVTNDAWFGKSREPLIHLAMAGYRAVEQRRFLVRSTNTGISALIDPVGRILEPTPVHARANRLYDVAMLDGQTVYNLLGDWLGLVGLGVLLFWWRAPLRELSRRVLLGRKGRASSSRA
jgi:apolipoprotein N-acyltransferase